MEGGGLTSILNADIIRTHILSRLDGMSLASAAATCSRLYGLASEEEVWAKVCQSTWPSTRSPVVGHVMRRFPQGSRSFFSDACTLPQPIHTTRRPNTKRMIMNLERTPRLISAVDLYYWGKPVASRVVETETVSEGFREEALRLEIAEAEEEEVVVGSPPPRRLIYPKSFMKEWELQCGLRLSWTVIDASGRRAINLLGRDMECCQLPYPMIGVQVSSVWEMEGKEESYNMRVWLSLEAEEEEDMGGEWKDAEMKLKKGWLEMEDMYGRKLNGRDALVILQRAFEAPRETLQVRTKRHAKTRTRRFVKGWFSLFCFFWDLLRWVHYVYFG